MVEPVPTALPIWASTSSCPIQQPEGKQAGPTTGFPPRPVAPPTLDPGSNQLGEPSKKKGSRKSRKLKVIGKETIASCIMAADAFNDATRVSLFHSLQAKKKQFYNELADKCETVGLSDDDSFRRKTGTGGWLKNMYSDKVTKMIEQPRDVTAAESSTQDEAIPPVASQQGSPLAAPSSSSASDESSDGESEAEGMTSTPARRGGR